MNQIKEKNSGRWLKIAAVGILLLLALAGYDSLRRRAGRFFGDFFYPYLSVARAGVDRISDTTLLLYSRLELAARVEQLMAANRALAAQNVTTAEVLRENAELRRLASLPSSLQWRYLACEVILRDPVHWDRRLTVGRGRADGLQPGCAVFSVTSDGRPILVGLIGEVADHSAEVVTVLNPELRITVGLSASGAIGVLNASERRQGGVGIPVGMLPASLKYTPGESVITTGFEQGIPRGIKIGEMLSVDPVDELFSSRLQLSGELKPAAQLNSIRFLMAALPQER
ncbi:MAG: rod shape-determining protein MreC [Victivallaceae bacterium]|nr:rod shape-determining protein MreC [Victivallaceae bacterium]